MAGVHAATSAALSRATYGDVPPQTIGSSTTTVGSRVWLHGGRLAVDQSHLADLYELDLSTLQWTKIEQAQDNSPCARYYHSMNHWNGHLVIFGGRAQEGVGDHHRSCVLQDVRFFDLSRRRWLPTSPPRDVDATGESSFSLARGRCGHLSAISGDRLFVFGGQDVDNEWIEDVCIYDLVNKRWLSCHPYPRRYSVYSNLAVSPAFEVRAPSVPESPQESPFIHLPFSVPSSPASPTRVYVCNVGSITPKIEAFEGHHNSRARISDMGLVSTSFLPSELHFPSGAVLGRHLIVAGSTTVPGGQSLSAWALDLQSLEWTSIDLGRALRSGDWHSAVLWLAKNKLVVFGRWNESFVDNRARLAYSWSHVLVTDLESYGIYQPPVLGLDIRGQQMGLQAFSSGADADFTIACDDRRELRCSRKLLEERWLWFREQRALFLQQAVFTPDAPHRHAEPTSEPALHPDGRMSLRRLDLGQPYAVTLALLQYLYSLALLTPLQHAPPVLSTLLGFSRSHQLPHLHELVKHAMHVALSEATARGVCEVARDCGCSGLERRALYFLASAERERRPDPSPYPKGRSRALTSPNVVAGNRHPATPTARASLPRKFSQNTVLPSLNPVELDLEQSMLDLTISQAEERPGKARPIETARTTISSERELTHDDETSVRSSARSAFSTPSPRTLSVDISSSGSASISSGEKKSEPKSPFARILSSNKAKGFDKEEKALAKRLEKEEAQLRKEHIMLSYHARPVKQKDVGFL